MTRIFISYRRQDTRQIAGRIFDRLEAHFGRDHVFMDIDSIPFGVDFHDYLDEQVARAETVLALIGPGWAEARDEAGKRRLDNPDDFVRIEIEAALRRGIPLGAVLIDGAPMPRPEQLPEDMRALCRRNAAPVDSGRDFNVHMSRLIADLERHLSGAVVEPVADAGSPDRGPGGKPTGWVRAAGVGAIALVIAVLIAVSVFYVGVPMPKPEPDNGTTATTEATGSGADSPATAEAEREPTPAPVRRPAEPADEPRSALLGSVFVGDTLGRRRDWFETQTGPPMESFGNTHIYSLDGCDVWADAIKQSDIEVISSLSMDLSHQCSVDWKALYPNLAMLGDTAQTTVGDFRKVTSVPMKIAGCLQDCGNAADPEILFFREGGRADQFINIAVGVTLDTSAEIDMADTARKRIGSSDNLFQIQCIKPNPFDAVGNAFDRADIERVIITKGIPNEFTRTC